MKESPAMASRERDVASHFPKRRIYPRMIALVVIFLACFFGSFYIGRYPGEPQDLFKMLFSQIFPVEQTWSDPFQTIMLNIRLPRIFAAALVGAALSTAGCVFQGLFKNPMVSPDILGASAGAGFGAALGLMLSVGYAMTSAIAFGLGLLAVLTAYLLSSRFKEKPILGMVLAGIMISSLFTAATSYLKLIADPTDQLPAITYWLMGSLSSIRTEDVVALLPVMLVGFVPILLLRWRMNVATLGDDEARSIGINIRAMRIIIILCATLLTASSVAVSGMIGWVGLVIPHLARQAVGCDYKRLIPATMLMGSSFLILVDDLARSLTTSEIPLGILTAFVGAPFFLYLFFAKRSRL